MPRAIRKSSSLEIASMAAVKPATIFSNGIDGVSGLPMTCSGMYGTWTIESEDEDSAYLVNSLSDKVRDYIRTYLRYLKVLQEVLD